VSTTGQRLGSAKQAVSARGWPVKSAALVAFLLAAALLFSAVFSGHRQTTPPFPASGPAEFLYLDGARVLAYLAQFDGGNFTSEQLTRKVSDTESSKLSLEEALELGDASQQEQSVARNITPTAAGNYIELLSKLEAVHGLKTIGLGRFNHEVHGLTEGQFVVFRTHALSPPVYLNPYLAVRQRRTLSTLFPMPPRGRPGRALVQGEREGALRFRDRVGRNPRVVFALRPLNERERTELAKRRALAGLVPAAAAERETNEAAKPPEVGEVLQPELRLAEDRAEERLSKKRHVEYLMPMDAQLITRERSLIKFGGGEFTVVGKVVRIFPEHGDYHSPAYVDSPTLETWEQPLAHAPPKLLCRTDPKCAKKLHAKAATAEEREKAIDKARAWALEALTEQTEIPKRGAVIVPIAIYK
jgi:hypothetical protein